MKAIQGKQAPPVHANTAKPRNRQQPGTPNRTRANPFFTGALLTTLVITPFFGIGCSRELKSSSDPPPSRPSIHSILPIVDTQLPSQEAGPPPTPSTTTPNEPVSAPAHEPPSYSGMIKKVLIAETGWADNRTLERQMQELTLRNNRDDIIIISKISIGNFSNQCNITLEPGETATINSLRMPLFRVTAETPNSPTAGKVYSESQVPEALPTGSECMTIELSGRTIRGRPFTDKSVLVLSP